MAPADRSPPSASTGRNRSTDAGVGEMGTFSQAEPDVMRDGIWTATITSADGRRQVARLELR